MADSKPNPAFLTVVDSDDITFVGFNQVEYAAIHLRVEHEDCPEWLNEMIREANRQELAKAAMQALISKTPFQEYPEDWSPYSKTAIGANDYADAMIAEGKK